MQNPWHTNLKKTKEKKICEVEPWLTRHVCIYDYLGGHKDFRRLIFVTAIEKLQILAFHQSFSILIIYKQQFLHCDWLRACQLIPNQCKKVKLSAKRWNWVQKSEIECKTVKLKWLTAPPLSSDKQNGGEKLNEDWNCLSKFQYNYLITS